MEIQILTQNFSVCKIHSVSNLVLEQWMFLGYTDEEISLVCPEDKVPEDVIEVETGWRAIRFTGILDFSLIGILAPVSRILAENKIGIFVISTFNTDYVLVKKENLERAISLLSDSGYEIK